jgi:hypothetical protein
MSSGTPTEWWEKNKHHYVCGNPKDLARGQTPGYGTKFCGNCGSWSFTKHDPMQKWRQYYLVGAWGCTEEKAREMLQVTNDPSVVTYSITHDGETHTFLWKDE